MVAYKNEILTVDEVTELLYIGKNTAYALLNSGELKGIRIGRSWRIPRESINDFILQKMKESYT